MPNCEQCGKWSFCSDNSEKLILCENLVEINNKDTLTNMTGIQYIDAEATYPYDKSKTLLNCLTGSENLEVFPQAE